MYKKDVFWFCAAHPVLSDIRVSGSFVPSRGTSPLYDPLSLSGGITLDDGCLVLDDSVLLFEQGFQFLYLQPFLLIEFLIIFRFLFPPPLCWRWLILLRCFPLTMSGPGPGRYDRIALWVPPADKFSFTYILFGLFIPVVLTFVVVDALAFGVLFLLVEQFDVPFYTVAFISSL